MLGTFVEVVSAHREAAEIAFAEIKRIEGLLSKYNPESEVSRLNQLGRLSVSPETKYIIKKAQEFWRASDGVFDITVGPLMDLWGFTQKKYYLPRRQEIEQVLNLIGMDKINFQDEANVIEFKIPSMKIDLGALAKGYAVDCAIRKLKDHGIQSCLINAGGDIYCLGDKFGRPWKVAVQNPRHTKFYGYLKLKDKAVATSGDYAQYFIHGNRRYTHIFNPKTGYPADSGVASVTVVAPDCLTADALATAIFVLGKVKGEELARRFSGVEVKIIEEKDA